MKKFIKSIIFSLFILVCVLGLTACNSKLWDSLGGGGTGTIPSESSTAEVEGDVADSSSAAIDGITEEQTSVEIPDESTAVTKKITISESGDYVLSGSIDGAVKIEADNVHLYLDNCTVTNAGKKVISSDNYGVIITLIGSNTVSNAGDDTAEAKNAIDIAKDLTFNGTGSLGISSTKSGIKSDGTFYGLGGKITIAAGNHGISADSIVITDSEITVTSAAKDAIHAESADTVTAFDYNKGFIYIDGNAKITASGVYGDGMQADTYVYIKSGTFNLTTLPTWIAATSTDGCFSKSGTTYTKVSSDEIRSYSGYYQLESSCKGIKVGEIDYDIDVNGTVVTKTVASENYTIIIDGGTFNISSTDDGLHTNSGSVIINGGTFTIATSDDGVHADGSLKVNGGSINVTKSYEGLEGMTIEIAGGTVKVVSGDDGINAANSSLSTAVQKQKCHIIISGGLIYVSASGDGIDSNGSVLISGGETYVSGPTGNGDGALDADAGIIITGGKLIAIGSSGMVETPATNSTQYCASINLSSSASGAVTLKSGSDTILSFNPSEIFGTNKNYQSVVISSPDLKNGSTYTLTTGSTTTSVKITSIITKVGNAAGGQGGPGGR